MISVFRTRVEYCIDTPEAEGGDRYYHVTWKSDGKLEGIKCERTGDEYLPSQIEELYSLLKYVGG